jgi:hypothetical protein
MNIWMCGCEWFLTDEPIIHLWPSTPPYPLGCQGWDCYWVDQQTLSDTINTYSARTVTIKGHSRWDLWRVKYETWKYRRAHRG